MGAPQQEALADRMLAASAQIGPLLPEFLREAFSAAIASNIKLVKMTDANQQVVYNATRLTEAIANHSLDTSMVLGELNSRNKLFRNMHDATASVLDDIQAYPRRWPGMS